MAEDNPSSQPGATSPKQVTHTGDKVAGDKIKGDINAQHAALLQAYRAEGIGQAWVSAGGANHEAYEGHEGGRGTIATPPVPLGSLSATTPRVPPAAGTSER